MAKTTSFNFSAKDLQCTITIEDGSCQLSCNGKIIATTDDTDIITSLKQDDPAARNETALSWVSDIEDEAMEFYKENIDEFNDGFMDGAPDGFSLKEAEDYDWSSDPTKLWALEWYRQDADAYDLGRDYAQLPSVIHDIEWIMGPDNAPQPERVEEHGDLTVTFPTSRGNYFCIYNGQNEAQPAILELKPEEGVLFATFNGEIGNAVPFSVYHGREIWFGFDPYMSLKDVRNMMADIIPFAVRVMEGYSTDLDSTCSNVVGVLDDDAMSAYKEIEEIIDSYSGFDLNDRF